MIEKFLGLSRELNGNDLSVVLSEMKDYRKKIVMITHAKHRQLSDVNGLFCCLSRSRLLFEILAPDVVIISYQKSSSQSCHEPLGLDGLKKAFFCNFLSDRITFLSKPQLLVFLLVITNFRELSSSTSIEK